MTQSTAGESGAMTRSTGHEVIVMTALGVADRAAGAVAYLRSSE